MQFFIWEMLGGKVFLDLLNFVSERYVCAPLRGTNMAAGKQRKYLLPSFATSVISSLEELVSIKVILFLRTVRIAIPPN